MIYYHIPTNTIYQVTKIDNNNYIIQNDENISIMLVVHKFSPLMRELGMIKLGVL